MNILIPIGGLGQRFKSEGYSKPKPLISVLGVPMIHRVVESITTQQEDIIHVVYNPELNYWNFKESLQKEFPTKKFNFIELEKQTRGAAETILLGLTNLDNNILSQSFLILDCDTFYSDDIVGKYKSLNNKNSIFYFKDFDDNPIFSYINFDSKNNITEIKEKVKISHYANTGAYGFKDGHLLSNYCQKIINKEGELYVSRVYEQMISDGEQITASEIEKFDCVGTPLQLRVYCEKETRKTKLRFCFDLDNTLVSFPQTPNDYSSVLPSQKNIDYLKFLKSQGAYIIIYTARRMKTHKGNVGAIVADIGKITIQTLEKFEIPYDEIVFGKPHAHFYVDDLAVNAFSSLDKELGFYKTQSEPRSFNKIDFHQDSVIKHTANKGEIFWYQNLPQELKNFCPLVIESDLETGFLKLERIKGINFSYLYTNSALQVTDLHRLLLTLEMFHSSKESKVLEINANANYTKKISERYLANLSLYEKLNGSDRIFELLMGKLGHYETSKKQVCLVHGDPVFSNVIMTHQGLRFIDPRGKIGEDLSLYGDINYDFAKVYQSIIGYDFILNDVEFNYEYIERMKSAFEYEFSQEQMKDIKIITASLFFSLIPLHDFCEKKFNKYISLTETLLK